MSANQSNALSVQGTNDSSIVSKHSAAQAGYVLDPFLSAFTLKKAPRRAPLINRGYYIRTKAIDTVIRSFLLTEGPKQIVSLGAGFDTTYFRLSSQAPGLMANVFYMEVDFPEVVERKKELIRSSTMCSTLIGANSEPNSPEIKISARDYCLMGADLGDVNNLDLLWTSCTRLQKDLPTFVLSECVMTYMEPRLSTGLIQFCQKYFTSSAFVTYEQVEPDDAFGQFMRAHFDKLNSSLKGISTFSNKEKQVQRYKACGYSQVEAISMKEFFDSLPAAEKERVSSIEYFDEFEEWHSKCFHYILVVARTGRLEYPDVGSLVESEHQSPCADSGLPDHQLAAMHWCEVVGQFAHSSCLLPLGVGKWLLLTHGGFGVSRGKHGRLNDLNLYLLNGKGEVMQEKTIPGLLSCRLHHTLTAVGDFSVFVFGGRLSPARPVAAPVILHVTGNTLDEVKIESTELNGVKCPDARWRHAAVHVVIDNFDCVIIAGGITAGDNSCAPSLLSSCHLFNIELQTWSCVPHYPRPVHSQSMCYDGRYVYSVGGLTSSETILRDCYRLDTHHCSVGWQEVVLPLECIYSHNLHVAVNKMFIVGGIGQCGQQLGLKIVELSTHVQTSSALPVKMDDGRLLMYFNHTSHMLWNGDKAVLLVVGGGGNCFSFGTHLNKRILAFEIC